MLPIDFAKAPPAIQIHRWPAAPGPRRNVYALLAYWRARARQRRALAGLDARMLRDIGITPEQAQAECAKPFWR